MNTGNTGLTVFTIVIFKRFVCVPSLHNPLYNNLLNCFFEPILHRSHIYSKDFRLLHGVLLGEVRRKHLEVRIIRTK